MLGGTERKPDEIVGSIPPNLSPCTVEKVAINAVMAGCKPEYMPVVLGVLEAALDPLFTMHGLLCTTHFSGPLVIINGPVAKSIGMNSGVNALGQGNRANATIGRALQLIVRNVGGGIPGAIDRATLGNPGKYTFCFAEDESDPAWEPLAQRRGIAAGKNAVTLFHGEGVHGFIDQKSRTPEELVRSLAMGLFGVGHPKLVRAGNAVLVLSPEHYRIFKDGGWSRRQIEDALYEALKRPGKDLAWGAQNVAEGISPKHAGELMDKFDPPPDGVLIVRAGGPARSILGDHRRLARPARPRGMPGRHQRDQIGRSARDLRRKDCATPLPRPHRPAAPASRRPSSLDGKTVALMDIGKSRGKEFIDRLEGHFKKAGIATKRYAKPTNTKVAPLAVMQQMAAEAQLAVIALSD